MQLLLFIIGNNRYIIYKSTKDKKNYLKKRYRIISKNIIVNYNYNNYELYN